MFGIWVLLVGTAIGSVMGETELLKFQEGDTVTIRKSGDMSLGCNYMMGRKEGGIYCCYAGELCDISLQSKECRKEGEYSVEKNFIQGNWGECILKLKTGAKKMDIGTYCPQFLGKCDTDQKFEVNVTGGLSATEISAIVVVVIMVLGAVGTGVAWKTKKFCFENHEADDEAILPKNRSESCLMTNA